MESVHPTIVCLLFLAPRASHCSPIALAPSLLTWHCLGYLFSFESFQRLIAQCIYLNHGGWGNHKKLLLSWWLSPFRSGAVLCRRPSCHLETLAISKCGVAHLDMSGVWVAVTVILAKGTATSHVFWVSVSEVGRWYPSLPLTMPGNAMCTVQIIQATLGIFCKIPVSLDLFHWLSTFTQAFL